MARAKHFAHWFATPAISRIGRDIVGAFLLGQGIIRVIDGRLFATTSLLYAPPWSYAVVQVILGLALLLTGGCRWRHTMFGRLLASATAGFCFLLAVAAYPASATSAWGAIVLTWVCVLEAGARDCQ